MVTSVQVISYLTKNKALAYLDQFFAVANNSLMKDWFHIAKLKDELEVDNSYDLLDSNSTIQVTRSHFPQSHLLKDYY
jgi:hypothetical protein